QFRAANAVAVQALVVVHGDGHLDQRACEFKWARVVRDRRSAIASDIEPRPRDEVEEAELGADVACGRTIDQQREFAATRLWAVGRGSLWRDPAHADAEWALASRYRCTRSDDHMFASDVHVMDEKAALHIEAVAGGRVAMGYEDAFACLGDVNIGLDPI